MALPHNIKRFLSSASQRTGPPGLAVFDCDGTIIRGDIGESMFYHQIRNFLFRESPADIWTDYPERKELARLFTFLERLDQAERSGNRRMIEFADRLLDWYHAQLAAGKTAKACADIVRLFAGFRPAELDAIAATTFGEEISSEVGIQRVGSHSVPRGTRFIRESVALLESVRKHGFDLYIVSGSNRWSVSPVGRRVGIPPEKIIGIDLEVSHGFCTRRAVNPVPVRDGKIGALSSLGLPRPVIVVSDSIYDLPLFEHSAGLRVLILSNNQSDRFFEERGRGPDEQWAIIDRPTELPADPV